MPGSNHKTRGKKPRYIEVLSLQAQVMGNWILAASAASSLVLGGAVLTNTIVTGMRQRDLARLVATDDLLKTSASFLVDDRWLNFKLFMETLDAGTRLQVYRSKDSDAQIPETIAAFIGIPKSAMRKTFMHDWTAIVLHVQAQARGIRHDRVNAEEVMRANNDVFALRGEPDPDGPAIFDRLMVDMDRLKIGDPNIAVFRQKFRDFYQHLPK
ncbi:MAG: hypothetical protein ACKVS8_11025 [Phycisphaerales bacterium]